MKTTVISVVCAAVTASSALAFPQNDQQPPLKPGNGVTAPRLTKEVRPEYPKEALASGAEGIVTLACVVQVDGTTGDIRVVKSQSPELDAAAVKALKEWRFLPGQKDGKPVPVEVTVEISFTTLKKGPRIGSPDVYKPGAGIISPKVIKDTKPAYPDAARESRVSGTVVMDCVVLADGTVGEVRVTKSLQSAIDAEAMRALKEWRFEPGTKDGKAVPVQVTVEMSFSLR